MGRKEKQKTKKTHSSDDDAEANEDLSLKIVEKALAKRELKPNPVPNDVVLDGDDVGASSSKPNEVVAVRYDGVFDEKSVIAVPEVGNVEIRTERKKRRKKKKKVESQDQSVVIAEEQDTVETIIVTEKSQCAEVASVNQTSDNIVMRKLLRGPRYFDPPDSSWGTCYNCGEEGHATVNCTAASMRKKPCFVCGSLEHGVKQCTKARDCFICKKGGHRAKACPERHNVDSTSLTVCLKCGNSGHEMFSCKYDYSLDDLKEIQCYVCKRSGHLCCVDTTDATQRQFSCYKCGQLGHTGLACSRLRSEATGAATPSSCYKCGEEGHFARECTSSVKACSRFQSETTGAATPSSCYKCGGEGHFARECTSSVKAWEKKRELSKTKSPRFQKENDYMGYRSAPHMSKTYKKKRPHTEVGGNTTPQKSKHRGGWTSEHPGDFSPVKSKRNSWMSPVTPSTESTKLHSFSNGSHTPSSKSYKARNAYDGTADSRGSAKAFHHRFSASRFDNSSGDGLGRSYDWW